MAYVLTIPEQSAAQKTADRAGGSSGQDHLLPLIAKSPLAISERGKPRHLDHIHLSRFTGTDLCQWFGRGSDGYHRPIGRIMQIVRPST